HPASHALTGQLRSTALRTDNGGARMDTLPTPAFTPLDAIVQAIGALMYLVVGVGSFIRAPRDVRTRVFLGLSVANLMALAVPAMLMYGGATKTTDVPRPAMAIVLSGLGVAALILFHFTQVFPRRRPWIRTSGLQMPIGYVLVPAAIAGLIWYMPADVETLSVRYMLAFLVFGFPLIVLLAMVLPVAAILSLIKSHREVQKDGLPRLRHPIEWILVGQIAGGTLAVVFAPVLAVVAPNTIAQALLTVSI